MRKLTSTAAILALTGLLMGCPPPKDGGAATDTPATDGAATDAATDGGDAAATDEKSETGIDISHVKVGQKYTYEMTNGMKMIYEITEIKPGVEIKYKTTTIMNVAGTETKTPGEGAYPLAAAAPADTTATPAAAPEPVATETIEVSGVKFECKVYENAGTKSWTSMTFAPGGVKTMQGENVVSELKSIE